MSENGPYVDPTGRKVSNTAYRFAVDAEVEGVDWPDASSHFEVLFRETAAFLTVVLRTTVSTVVNKRDWTWALDPDGTTSPGGARDVYFETEGSTAMPARTSAARALSP